MVMLLKENRHEVILDMLEQKSIVRVVEIKEKLNVTEVTIRRDLKELENKGFLQRVHGGAKKINKNTFEERSNLEKRQLNIEEKKHIGKLAASLIKANDVIFIGSGTTNEFIIDYIQVNHLKVVTNSIDIFSKLSSDERFEVILIGGRLRRKTGTFIGPFSNNMLELIHVHKAFVGTNGIFEGQVTTANEEEGNAQKIILDKAEESYIVADTTKLGVKAFYGFFSLKDSTALITGKRPSEVEKIEKYTRIVY